MVGRATRGGLLLALFLGAAPGPAAAQAGAGGAPVPVELELVLAVDVSSSVDLQEFVLQMQGLARAFGRPEVHDAIADAGPRGIAVALVQWSSWRSQRLSVPWTRIRGPADARAFAEAIRRAPRYGTGGSTGVAGALEFSLRALESNRFAGVRRAIDVSGDGMANQGPHPGAARDRAAAAGVTVNGLAILNDFPRLDRYYREAVTGGPSSFVMVADDYGDFAEAILRKLVREIAGPPLS